MEFSPRVATTEAASAELSVDADHLYCSSSSLSMPTISVAAAALHPPSPAAVSSSLLRAAELASAVGAPASMEVYLGLNVQLC